MTSFYWDFLSDASIRLAKSLRNNYGIEPVLWATLPQMQPKIARDFGNVDFIDGGQVKRCIWPAKFKDLAHAPFDETCHSVWVKHAQILHEMLQRDDHSNDYNTLDKVETLYEELVFWNALLRQVKPDLVYLWVFPHTATAMLVYLLAQEHGIRTLMYNYTNISPFGLMGHNWRRGGNLWLAGLRMANWEKQAGLDVVVSDLRPSTRERYERVKTQRYDLTMPWQLVDMNKTKGNLSAFSRLFLKRHFNMFCRCLRSDLRRKRRRRKITGDSRVHGIYAYKEKDVMFRDSYQSGFYSVKHWFQTFRNEIATLKSHRDYRSRAKTLPDATATKYVFCCLSLQPEGSSQPMGELLSHQFLMVNMLVNCTPSDWEVWVKEHPCQFMVGGGAPNHRNERYYQMLVEMPRVRLVPLDLDQFYLVDNSCAVATLTGSVGWEALVRGKPALTFGHIWYGECQGAYNIRNFHECRLAMEKIINGVAVDVTAMALLLKELELSAFECGHEYCMTPLSIHTTTANIEEQTRHIGQVLDLPEPGHELIRLSELLT
jgi:hypothetical protein